MQAVLYGRAEQVPGEGKWTYMMKSSKRTLLRKIVHGCGVFSTSWFPSKGSRSTTPCASAPDDEPDEKALRSLRMSRACEYYGNDANMHELAVHVLVMRICDDLFYGMLGGVERDQQPHKVADLVRPNGSPITDCLGSLLELASGGLDKPDNKWWAVVHLVKAPTNEQKFRMFALGQVLRMHSAVYRRYVTKFTGWPFRLYCLCSDTFPDEAKRRTIGELLMAKECCLDAFARGIRKLFPSGAHLLSPEAATTLKNSFDSMRLVTDFSERSHAQCRCASRSATGPRAFSHTANEVFLKQAAVVHVNNGGQAVGSSAKPAPILEEEGDMRVTTPLLQLPEAAMRRGVPADAPQGVLGDRLPEDEDPSASHHRASPSRSEQLHMMLPAPLATGGHALTAHADEPLPLAISEQDVVQSLFEPCIVSQPSGHALKPLQDKGPENVAEPVAKRPRRGLNPMMLYVNHRLRAVKEAGGGKTLTKGECAEARSKAMAD